MMKVTQMTSRTGRPVANQFIIQTDNGVYFQSYKSIIAFIPKRPWLHESEKQYPTTLDENYWDYSATTGKYRNEFLGEGIAETRKKIKDGIYILADLNKGE